MTHPSSYRRSTCHCGRRMTIINYSYTNMVGGGGGLALLSFTGAYFSLVLGVLLGFRGIFMFVFHVFSFFSCFFILFSFCFSFFPVRSQSVSDLRKHLPGPAPPRPARPGPGCPTCNPGSPGALRARLPQQGSTRGCHMNNSHAQTN